MNTILHVLVTRPAPEGIQLSQLIQLSGDHAVYFPTIDIRPLKDLTRFKKQVSSLDQCDVVIFTSPQAIYQSAAMIHAQWTQFPKHLQIVCIGRGTANAINQANLPSPVYPKTDWNSEGVLNLSLFKNIKGKKIALIRGKNGRKLLAEELTRRGANVISMIVYERSLPKLDKKPNLDLNRIDVIVCTSNDIIRNLKKLVGRAGFDMLAQKVMIVVGERMADLAREMGLKKILSANSASHDDIMAMLRRAKENL